LRAGPRNDPTRTSGISEAFVSDRTDLGTILGLLAKTSFLRSLIRYDNDWTIFFRRP
jgi:hypothetical protein